jgi:hypothetical protein
VHVSRLVNGCPPVRHRHGRTETRGRQHRVRGDGQRLGGRPPSGAPALILRLDLAGKTLAYTGDTAWTNTLVDAATDVDLPIAEAYYRDKNIPYHLRLADLDKR